MIGVCETAALRCRLNHHKDDAVETMADVPQHLIVNAARRESGTIRIDL